MDGGTPGDSHPLPDVPWGSPNATSLVFPESPGVEVGGPQVLCHPVPGVGGPWCPGDPLGWDVPMSPEWCGGLSPSPVSLIWGGSCGGSPDGGVPGVPHPGLRRTRARTGQPPRGGRRTGVPPEPPSQDLPALHFLQVRGTPGARGTHGGHPRGEGHPGGDTHGARDTRGARDTYRGHPWGGGHLWGGTAMGQGTPNGGTPVGGQVRRCWEGTPIWRGCGDTHGIGGTGSGVAQQG